MIQFLGKGTYGEVYRPFPIECNETKRLQPKKNFIGKLSNKRSAPKDLYIHLQNVRRTIDPHQTFTIPLKAICPKTKDNENSIYWKPNKDIEYVSLYGGVSFDRVTYRHIRSNILCVHWIFLSFYPIMDGLQHMHQKKIVHFDIKLANLVYDIEKNKTRLIDYDLTMNHNELIKKVANDKIFKDVFYEIWPPEINLNVSANGVKSIPAQSKIYIKSLTPLSEKFLDSIEEYTKSENYRKDRIFPSRIDIFSLGIVFAQLFWDTDPDIWLLTQKMIEIDPSKRINVSELISRYKIIYHYLVKTKFPTI